MKKLLPTVLVALMFLTACEQNMQDNQKQVIGTGAGAVIGGILGSKVGKGSGQLWATGAGALIGALVGSEVGKSLDRSDKLYANQANERAKQAPLGETIAWNNPDSGNSGTITPTRDGSTASGEYCREFYQTIMVGGREEQAYGTACRNPDGTWRIVN